MTTCPTTTNKQIDNCNKKLQTWTLLILLAHYSLCQSCYGKVTATNMKIFHQHWERQTVQTDRKNTSEEQSKSFTNTGKDRLFKLTAGIPSNRTIINWMCRLPTEFQFCTTTQLKRRSSGRMEGKRHGNQDADTLILSPTWATDKQEHAWTLTRINVYRFCSHFVCCMPTTTLRQWT